MRRIVLWLCGTTSAVVLLFSYHTSTQGSGGGRPTAAAGIVSGTAASPEPAGSPNPASPAPRAVRPKRSTTASRTSTVVVNGRAVSTDYGDVQVQITVNGRRITAARAISYPTGGRDSEINDAAVPLLGQETLAAQSAQIDTVSGATYTSEGYRTSLQSALDAAHL